VNLDQKQPGFPEHVLPAYLESIGVDYHILEQDTYSVVVDKTEPGKTYCGLCSRLRRGSLYSYAERIGATKIALGHHRNDLLETLFLNMFFGGKLKAMPPKLLSDDDAGGLGTRASGSHRIHLLRAPQRRAGGPRGSAPLRLRRVAG